MKYLAALMVIGFVGFAIFGFFGMHIGMQDHNTGCVSSIAQGIVCPKQISPIGYLTFHMATYRGISSAVFAAGATKLVLTALALLYMIGLGFAYLRLFKQPEPAFYRRSLSKDDVSPGELGFIRWISLHENSPSIR